MAWGARLLPVALFCLLAMQTAGAVSITNTTSPTVLSEKSGSRVLHFQPNVIGELTLGFLEDSDPRRSAPTPDRLRIIDNTLLSYDYVPGIRANDPLQIRIGFSGRAIRAGLRRLGVRADRLRALRYDDVRARWIRASTLRRASGDPLKAQITAPQPLVWAVTDNSSALFSVAALTAIPEPATLALGSLGLLALGWRRRSAPSA